MNMKKDLAADLIKEDQQISWDTMKNKHLIFPFLKSTLALSDFDKDYLLRTYGWPCI